MKIALPTNENNMEAGVCMSFGRAPFYLFYNTETKESRFVENSAANSQGGAGIKAAQTIADEGTQAMLTPRCGENAANVLKAAKIKIYRTISDNIMQNINAFVGGSLPELANIHAGFHNHG